MIDAAPEATGVGTEIPIRYIHPDPEQPRLRAGDLQALADSIAEHGILHPILVRRMGDKDFRIIAGERRYHAALRAGLDAMPCVVRDAREGEALELALIENVLRCDLDPFEEAGAYDRLIHDHRYTHGAVARRVGKSRTSITESVSLLAIPEEVRDFCEEAGITAKRQLVLIARRRPDREAMMECAARIARGLPPGTSAKKRKGGTVFRYAPKGGPFRLRITFRQSGVEDAEIVEALEDLLRELRTRKSENEPEPVDGEAVVPEPEEG